MINTLDIIVIQLTVIVTLLVCIVFLVKWYL
jgi:hypothetical protein